MQYDDTYGCLLLQPHAVRRGTCNFRAPGSFQLQRVVGLGVAPDTRKVLCG